MIMNCKYLLKKTRVAYPKPKLGRTERKNIGKTQAGGTRFETGTLGCKSKKQFSRMVCLENICHV